MRKSACSLLVVSLLSLAPAAAPAEPDPHLAPLLPLVGKTWRGALSPEGAAKPVVDVHRFELALGGHAVRSLHSINDGEYGGESLFVWDEAQQTLVYTYFTTGGFYTTGTLHAGPDGALETHEVVHGATGGVSEVAATSRVLPDGRFHVRSRLLKDGQWRDGHEVYYREDPTAVVRFKD